MDTEWSKAFGTMSYGIYILTSAHEGKINGMIASWVSQVSSDPPIVMVAVHPNRYSHQLIEESNHFALHSLDRSQKDFIKQFKGPNPALKFESLSWSTEKTGCPLLKDCLGYVECLVRNTCSPGNHTLFFGEVIEARVCGKGEPLTTLDYEGVYLGKA